MIILFYAQEPVSSNEICIIVKADDVTLNLHSPAPAKNNLLHLQTRLLTMIMLLLSHTTTMTTAQAPLDQPSCWLCLGEGPDSFGQPLVRNCSCRGSSGFAHISCIVSYAESESKRAYTSGDMGDSLATFEVCPNCKQDYQNNVAYELSRAQVNFVEREFAGPQHGFLYTNALTCRLVVLNVKNENDRYEGEVIISKMLSTFEAMKHTAQHRSHLLHPDATKAFEGHANANIATFYHKIGSDDSLQKAKVHFQKAKCIFEKEGDELGVMTINNLIENVEAEISGGGRKQYLTQGVEVGLELRKYQLFTKEFGADDNTTIEAGVQLALAMWKEFRTIEAERLLTNLITRSRRVHGEGHDCTIFAFSAFQRVHERKVFLKQDDEINVDEVYRIIRYTADGEKCLLQGPVPKVTNDPRIHRSDPSNDEGSVAERTFEVDRANVVTSRGTPVVCTGLQKGVHLNGKIGDRREFDEDTGRYTIHFEDETLKPVKVKAENIRIVFDL